MISNTPPQNEWEVKRLGKFTASRINDLLKEPRDKAAKERGDFGETAKTYIVEKFTEIATGTTRQLSTFSTEWGNEYEPVAASKIKEVHPDFVYLGKDNPQFFDYTDFSGGSSDGYSLVAKLIGETKCPENPTNHMKYVMMEKPEDLQKTEPDYYGQIQFNMMCFAKHFNIPFEETRGLFVSYCPLVEGDFEHLAYKLLYLPPDVALKEKIEKALERAESALADMYTKMKNIKGVLLTPQPDGVTIAEALK